MGDALTIRAAHIGDAAPIAAIYAPYVSDGPISFEIDPPNAAEMAARMTAILLDYPWLVAERGGVLAGYAYATRLYDRAAYRWAAEATVYVDRRHQRRGVGRALYAALIDALRDQGFQAVFGKITLPNPPSVALHEAFGFVRNGVLERVGYKHGAWHDVGIYQLDFGDRPARPAETLPFRG